MTIFLFDSLLFLLYINILFIIRIKVLDTAPAQLTQNYYECYQNSDSAFFNALGIASGNTQLAVPLAVLALLPVLYILLVAVRKVPPKEEYTNLEKDQAIEILSILLLRIRDGKTRGVKSKGVLLNLTKELIAAAKEDGGYPDSDDENEDSDDETPKKRKKSLKPKHKADSDDEEGYVDSDNEQEIEEIEAVRPSHSRKNSIRKSKSHKKKRNSVSGRDKSTRVMHKMAVFTK